MNESFEDARTKGLRELDTFDMDSDQATTIINNLKTLAESQQILTPDPIPDPEPTGFKGFLRRNGEDLIKVGGTVTVVAIIGLIEAKGDVIFRSKASKFI